MARPETARGGAKIASAGDRRRQAVPRARADDPGIVRRIARENPGAAQRVARRIGQAAAGLTGFATRRVGRVKGTHEGVFPGRPTSWPRDRRPAGKRRDGRHPACDPRRATGRPSKGRRDGRAGRAASPDRRGRLKHREMPVANPEPAVHSRARRFAGPLSPGTPTPRGGAEDGLGRDRWPRRRHRCQLGPTTRNGAIQRRATEAFAPSRPRRKRAIGSASFPGEATRGLTPSGAPGRRRRRAVRRARR